MIFHHWLGLMVDNEAVPEEFGYSVAYKAAFFYADGGLVASTNLLWIQWSFDVLIGLFQRLGIQSNMVNIVAMVWYPGPIYGRQSTAAY